MNVMSVTNPPEKIGEVTLRAVLYKLKLRDGSSLVGEVHQATAISPVDVVVGNTEEAGKMIEIMNKMWQHFCTTQCGGGTWMKNSLEIFCVRLWILS